MKNSVLICAICISLVAFTGHRSLAKNENQKTIYWLYEKDTSVYIQHVVEFMSYITRKITQKMLLVDQPFDFKYFDCKAPLLRDTAHFSKEELSFIQYEIANSELKKWSSDIVPIAKIINWETNRSIFSNPRKSWPYFRKHFGNFFKTYSAPVFLRNYSYCLFYSSDHCGGTCGGGDLILYKKEGQDWIEITTYCGWIS